MTTFERIKQTADERGLNLKQTALKAGLSENALYRYNQGVKPKFATVKAVADVLDVSTDHLLDNNINEMHANKKVADPVDLAKVLSEEGVAVFNGQPLSKEYKNALLAVLNTMKDTGK